MEILGIGLIVVAVYSIFNTAITQFSFVSDSAASTIGKFDVLGYLTNEVSGSEAGTSGGTFIWIAVVAIVGGFGAFLLARKK